MVSDCVRIHADFSSLESRMKFVIHLAKKNVLEQTGGPFAAAVFDMHTQQLIAVGMNLVVATNNASNHAEMVALELAQQTLQSFSLAAKGRFELLSSCEPCAMCFGALPWAGIKHLACAACTSDAEAIGFDEGPRHPDWMAELTQRGIQVTTEILRPEAVAVLQHYHTQQGKIYNA